MALDWIPREGGIKDHQIRTEEFFGTQPPCTMFELKPVVDPEGNPVKGLNTAWITLNNPDQLNSYTTAMLKAVAAGFSRASMDRSVVAVILTGTGTRAFCTGGNTREYAEYYANKPTEYGSYIDIFWDMIDTMLSCRKPTICRVNGMRVAGGQEMGMACDFALASDLAIFGQAGPRHGSAAVGGASAFLPWYLSIEDAMYSCVMCEMWSAYKMKRLGYVSKVVPVLKQDGKFIRNPLVITDKYVDDGELVYGEFVTGDEAKKAREMIKTLPADLSLLDKAVNDMVWTLTNLFQECVGMSVNSVRVAKREFWDKAKNEIRYWLGANMMGEAFLGFNAFNTKKITGRDTIDFIKYRQMIAEGHAFDDELFEAVLGKPQ